MSLSEVDISAPSQSWDVGSWGETYGRVDRSLDDCPVVRCCFRLEVGRKSSLVSCTDGRTVHLARGDIKDVH